MTPTIARSIVHAAVLSTVAFVLAPVATAQTSSKSVVTVEAAGPAAPVAAGETFAATITLRIRSGYHINAQKPSEDYLIGTTATVSAPRGFSVVRSSYPKSRMGPFSFSETPIAVYDGNAQIAVTLKADAAAPVGVTTIPAKVEFQACNDDQCLPPSTVDVSFTVDVTSTGDATAGEKQTVTVTGAPPDARIFVDGKAAGIANAQGRAVLRDVAVGPRKVRVESTGFLPFEKDVEVVADAPATVVATLMPDPNANTNAGSNSNSGITGVPLPAAVVPNTNSAAAVPPATDSSSWLLWVLGGVIVAALAGIGIAAATRRGPG